MMTRTVFAALLLAAIPASRAEAFSYQLAHTFRDPEPEARDFFGTAIAIEDGVVAIKSRSGGLDGDGFSRTHVFEANASGGFDEVATFDFDNGAPITIDNPEGGGNFFLGQEIALNNGVIAVGYGEDSLSFSRQPVQVLERDASGVWSRQFASLAAETPTPTGILREAGRTVGISGDTIIAEATVAVRPGGNQLAPYAEGGARVFQRQADNTWLETTTLFAPVDDFPSGGSPFSVALDGDTALLAFRDLAASEPGHHYFFERDPAGEWSLAASFERALEESFTAIAEIDGDWAVTRALGTQAFVFYERVEGVWRESLGPPEAGDRFTNNQGFAIEGDLFARTVEGVLEDGSSVVELFRRNPAGEWDLLTTIENPLPDAGLDFGAKLALDGGRLLIGARSVLADPTTPGAAFLFVPVPEPSAAVLAVVALGVLAGRRR